MGSDKKDNDDFYENEMNEQISLQDVLNQSPAESKAETRVLRSVEDADDVEKGNRLAGTILEGVPEDASHLFQKTPSTAAAQPESVEEELYDLTNQMMTDTDAATDTTNGGGDEQKSRAQSDAFVGNADHLIKQARLARFKKKTKAEAKETFADFKSFLAFRKDSMWLYSRHVLILIAVATLWACLLFYFMGNPGGSTPDQATVSWWLLFVFVRHPLTLTLAKVTESFVIDFLCLRRPMLLKIIGPFFTLLLVQSKGWPFQLTVWGSFDFAMLYGDNRFARHWLFYQDAIHVFNERNQAGTVTQANVYKNILILFVGIGIAVALKRFSTGLFYGQAVFKRYGKELSKVMKKSILLGKLAQRARNQTGTKQHRRFKLNYENASRDGMEDEEETYGEDENSPGLVIDTRRKNAFSGDLALSQEMKIRDLLGEWDEPTTDERKVENASISAIVQFRTAASCIDGEYPFSSAFGLADKRESCIDSSQKLYLRLKAPDSPVLNFDDIAVVALKQDGTLDEAMVKDLIHMFRPTRDGELTMLDFVKSIDSIYKDLRLTRASIVNVQKMNAASQRLWDVVFYFIVGCIVLAVIGIDPIALIASLFALIVGFAFMVGNAFSKAFEGLLLVLVRKPYDVGDRIAVANCNQDASGNGSSGWIVKDVDLYTTVLVYGTTGEEATITNGYLNQYRIMNMNRSPKAVLNFVMKFGIEVRKETIEDFGKRVEEYVKSRPREWVAFSAFRLTGVEADLGYVEYKIVLQHRESWQQIGALLNSKADVHQFAFELSKKLGMDYESPPMPIIVSKRRGGDSDEAEQDDPLEAVLAKMD